MYVSFRSAPAPERAPDGAPDPDADPAGEEPTSPTRKGAPSTAGARRVGGTVLALGTTSLLIDLSTEMVNSVLPLYLIAWMAAAPWQVGMIEALQQGVQVLVRMGSAAVADRRRLARPVALTGYTLSVLARIPLITMTGIGGVTAAVLTDRVGKGIRTAPRDALIARAAPPGMLATAFGVHRALDGIGALLGPVVAFFLLTFTGGSFGSVFFVSAVVAGMGVLVFWAFVPGDGTVPVPRATGARAAGRPLPPPSPADAVLAPSLPAPVPARAPASPVSPATPAVPAHRTRGVMRLGVTAAMLSATVVADTVVILALQRRLDLSVGSFPLLFVVIGGVAAAGAVPVGRWVDRAGPRRALLAGHVLFGVTAAVTALDAGSWWWAGAVVVLLGLAHAATDGVLGAYTAALAPTDRSSRAQGLTQTAVALGRSVGALAFGITWQQIGFVPAAWAWALAAVVAVAVAWFVLPGTPSAPRRPAGDRPGPATGPEVTR